jgi:hypothetical protein
MKDLAGFNSLAEFLATFLETCQYTGNKDFRSFGRAT